LIFLLPSLLLGTAPFLGILSHILLDMLTPSGVQLAWPKNTSYVILGGPVRTGSRTERWICLALFAVSVWLTLALVLQRPPFELLKEVLKW
jgi:inner membrane protein